MVHCVGIGAASAHRVGRGGHVEVVLSPSVGCLCLMVRYTCAEEEAFDHPRLKWTMPRKDPSSRIQALIPPHNLLSSTLEQSRSYHAHAPPNRSEELSWRWPTAPVRDMWAAAVTVATGYTRRSLERSGSQPANTRSPRSQRAVASGTSTARRTADSSSYRADSSPSAAVASTSP